MIANPSKLHALLTKKDQKNTSCKKISIQGNSIEFLDFVKRVRIQLDYKLKFDPRISELCRNTAAHLICLKRLRGYIGFEERKSLLRICLFKFHLLSFSVAFLFSKIMHKIEKDKRMCS